MTVYRVGYDDTENEVYVEHHYRRLGKALAVAARAARRIGAVVIPPSDHVFAAMYERPAGCCQGRCGRGTMIRVSPMRVR